MPFPNSHWIAVFIPSPYLSYMVSHFQTLKTDIWTADFPARRHLPPPSAPLCRMELLPNIAFQLQDIPSGLKRALILLKP